MAASTITGINTVTGGDLILGADGTGYAWLKSPSGYPGCPGCIGIESKASNANLDININYRHKYKARAKAMAAALG